MQKSYSIQDVFIHEINSRNFLKIVLIKQKRFMQIFTTNDLSIYNTIIKTLKLTTRNVFITFSFYLKLSNLSSNKSSKNSKKIRKSNIKEILNTFLNSLIKSI